MDSRKELDKKFSLLKEQYPPLQKIRRYRDLIEFFKNDVEIDAEDKDITSSCLFDAMNGYELKEKIGQGAFGIIKKARKIDTDEFVAIKIQEVDELIAYHQEELKDKQAAEDYVEKQITLEDKLLKMTGQYISSVRRIKHPDIQKHYSIMPLFNGDKIKNKFITLAQADKIACLIKISTQVKFLHDNGFVHLDIWRDNILLADQPMLHDFGCAAELKNGEAVGKLKGSHIPPEIFEQHRNKNPCIYGVYSDVYALGMTFYELWFHDYYDFNLDGSLSGFIDRYTLYQHEAIKKLTTDSLGELIKTMLVSDPALRPNMDNVMNKLSSILIDLKNENEKKQAFQNRF